MAFIIRRREALLGGTAAAALAFARSANGQGIPTAAAEAPKLTPENGASLRVLRPARFVPDSKPVADLLREMSAQTQFIVITHNRNTVQAADIIYGITMGRDSASQVISLRLDQVTDEMLKRG